MLFEWYTDGDVPSQVFDGFKLSKPSARVFDALARRVGASLAGRNTYEDSDRFGDDGSPHPTAPLFVLSHRPAPEMTGRQTLVSTGIEDAIAAAREAAGDKDVCLMGGGVVTEALKAGLVDELVLHQVPVLLGGGRCYAPDAGLAIALALRDPRRGKTALTGLWRRVRAIPLPRPALSLVCNAAPAHSGRFSRRRRLSGRSIWRTGTPGTRWDRTPRPHEC